MSKGIYKPEDSDEVFEIMKEYKDKKGYRYKDEELKVIAEDCFLLFESRGWLSGNKPIKYYPAVVMRWLLGNATRNNRLPLTGNNINFRKQLLDENDNGF